MTSRFFRKTIAVAVMVTSSLIPNVVLAPAASAQVPLRGALALVAGEDPSIPGFPPATGDARLQLPDRVRLTIVGMDPARFPAGPSCSAEVRVGAIGAKGLMLVVLPAANIENVFGADVTMLDFRQIGIVHAGDTAQARIRCEFVIAGVRQRHETLWAGTLR